jgi:ATP-dependent Lon protease
MACQPCSLTAQGGISLTLSLFRVNMSNIHRGYAAMPDNSQLSQKIIQAIQNMPSENNNEFAVIASAISSLELPPLVRSRLTDDLRVAAVDLGETGQMIKSYLKTVIQLPWGTQQNTINIDQLRADLDSRHYGMQRVKDKIIEHISIQNTVGYANMDTLCLIGPPGVGKTSMAQSIATAMGAELIRIALGGMHNEAELRGHRRTYVGAMPGKIIKGLTHAKGKPVVILLDEIDKIEKQNTVGDPSAALLEILDPKQNAHFLDNYLDFEYDLSSILFIATANTADIPRPLRDRMDILELDSYTELEKIVIAEKYLIPDQIKKNGLNPNSVEFDTKSIRYCISNYTRESGVRSLNRVLNSVCKKVFMYQQVHAGKDIKLTVDNIPDFIADNLYHVDKMDLTDRIGRVNALAKTGIGGSIDYIDVSVLDGTDKILMTGSLGDVLKESMQVALSAVRMLFTEKGLSQDLLKGKDIHIHMVDGATKKDGPSAGLALATALYSALTGTMLRGDVAMTGEISLRGEAMPIGGLRDKVLAAHREGITKVIIPYGNRFDIKNIPSYVVAELNIVTVKNLEEVLYHTGLQ